MFLLNLPCILKMYIKGYIGNLRFVWLKQIIWLVAAQLRNLHVHIIVNHHRRVYYIYLKNPKRAMQDK